MAVGDEFDRHGAEILGDDQVDGVRRAGTQQIAEVLDHDVDAGAVFQPLTDAVADAAIDDKRHGDGADSRRGAQHAQAK